jgi:hypothetical protein
MNDRAWIASRKGLFSLQKQDGRWALGPIAFLGEPVSMVLADPRDGALYAALNLGHFGVKLHRKDAGAEHWTEIAAPAYPLKPEDASDPVDWSVKFIWSLACGGADQPGAIWAGTLPGGLFRSSDRGESWALVSSLWDAPERREWFGGGYDVPGIHSICVDPRDSRHVLVGISCGGSWVTHDGGDRSQGYPRSALVPASQWHLALQQLWRRLAGSQHRAFVEFRFRRGRASRRRQYRLVCPGAG